MRQIIVIGNREEIIEFCPEDEIQDWETHTNGRARRYLKWKRRTLSEYLERRADEAR
jgi:hypothetical protein